MKVYREWRISGDTTGCAGSGRRSSAASITASRPGIPATRAWSRSRTTTPTTSSSGARTACARASTSARCRRRSLMGQALGDDVASFTRRCWPKGRRGSRRSCSTASTSSRRVEWKDSAGQDPLEDQEHRRRLLARGPSRCSRRKGRSTSTATAACPTACSAPGWRWSAASGRCSTRARSPATCGRFTATTSSATSPASPTRSGPPTPAARRAACCSAPGPRAASCRCRSSIPTKSGPASNTRWPRT